MKVCEAASLAVPGVWPLMFPGNGYHGQINWLDSLVGCMGQKAYSALLSAAKEGEVELPQHVAVQLSNGQVVEIGPDLTIPNIQKVSRKMPHLSICLGDETVTVKHKSCEKVDNTLAQPGGEEHDFDDGHSLLEQDEVSEDYPDLVQEEKTKTEDVLCQGMQLDVQCDSEVDDFQLRKHFSQFGEVISVSTTGAGKSKVTFASSAIVEQLSGEEHSVLLGGDQNVRLRLRGGSGRAQVPPQAQQDALNPFRYDIKNQMKLLLNCSGTHTTSIPPTSMPSPGYRQSNLPAIARQRQLLLHQTAPSHTQQEWWPSDSSECLLTKVLSRTKNFRLVHSVSYYVLAALLHVSYEQARACFRELVMYEVMKVCRNQLVLYVLILTFTPRILLALCHVSGMTSRQLTAKSLNFYMTSRRGKAQGFDGCWMHFVLLLEGRYSF